MQRVREQIGAEQVSLRPWQRHGITVAVLDTGMAEHPDLEGRQIAFFDFVQGKGRETRSYDDNGHGTHVCGILCGSGKMSGGRYRGIAPDSRFKREGDDLYQTVPLDLYTAVLGGEVIVDTLTGRVKLKVQPGTQNGAKVRLKGKGFPVYKQEGQSGDLIITYSIVVPTNLNERQKELFRQLQSLS